MPDPRFFKRESPRPLADIASLTGSELSPASSGNTQIADVAPLDTAGPGDLSFFDNVKYREQFAATRAGACFVAPDAARFGPSGGNTVLLLNQSPYKAYAVAAQAFYPERAPAAAVSPHAHIDPSAEIGPDCIIEAGAVIGAGVKIGRGCRIGANA
ncbi:MAG TPA: LpxD N-terminal domain-containing protein, partial [Alphaproteobacteria bacterium]